jgi:hypothetical protein
MVLRRFSKNMLHHYINSIPPHSTSVISDSTNVGSSIWN